jgi:hypothetical protein
MAKTTPKKSKKTPATPKRDRHSTPVVLVEDGTLIAGKRRIAEFTEKNPAARIVASEWWHFGSLPYLRAAKDEDGRLHITNETTAAEHDWTIIADPESRHG